MSLSRVTTISVLQAAVSMAQMRRMRRLFGITKGDYSSMYLETKRTITNIHILGPTNPMITLTGTNSLLLGTMHCNALSDNEANSYEFFE